MATALELKREGWRRFTVPGPISSEQTTISAALVKEREDLFIRLRKAAGLLKTKFGARRVILIGSIAHTLWFKPESDIDIVVDGLPVRSYWEAWQTIEDEVADRPVDLIDLETVSESLKRSITRYGIEL